MSLAGEWWRKICVPLDGFLWHRDISHPIIRPLLRNLILASGAAVAAGGALWAVWPKAFWFACGLLCMSWIFWGWARLFLRISLADYGAALMRAVFFNFLARLALIAALLYVAMALFQASAVAIVAGMAAGGFLGLASYAWHSRRS